MIGRGVIPTDRMAPRAACHDPRRGEGWRRPDYPICLISPSALSWVDGLLRGICRLRLNPEREGDRQPADRAVRTVLHVELAQHLDPRRDRELAELERVADRAADRIVAALERTDVGAPARVGG